MVHFSKLKLYGFKSFVDKTELEIGPGLNGIVGPNGCGKSNLVEALRWVMGEKSAKNMRGGGMEDVIFAGTSKRPARNLAEVTVVIDNQDGTAPAPFNAATEIEINRKIEKDKGSQYRVNGKAVRARDVNLLFADTMTGANSPALVSQGRITEIITAKPEDRRKILEESAGITGLHSRRHEAELRLRAAEQNLTRLDDSLGEMRSRLSSLKRQARQADRYKDLSDQIRRLDMALSWSEWKTIHAKIKQDREIFSAHNETVQKWLKDTQDLTAAIEKLEGTLPSLRKNHMEAQAVLQNFRVSLERLEQDIQSKAKGLQDAIEARAQLDKDSEFVQSQYDQVIEDMDKAVASLNDLQNEGTTLPEEIEKAEQNLAKQQMAYQELLNKKHNAETAIAVAAQSRVSLENQKDGLNATIEKLNNNMTVLSGHIQDTETALKGIDPDNSLSVSVDDLKQDIDQTTQKINNQIQQVSTAHDHYETTKRDLENTESDYRTLVGEYQGLKSIADRSQPTDQPQGDAALLSHLSVTEGYERAVSMALGQWLSMAGTNNQASVYWSGNGASVKTPKDAKPLSDFVQAPKSLSPLLNAVGVVDAIDGQTMLEAGQMLVTQNGDVHRWDGLVVSADAASFNDQASVILEQQNRMAALERDIAKAEKEKAAKQALVVQAKDTLSDAETTLETLRTDLTKAENTYRETVHAQDRLRDQQKSLLEKLSDYQDRLKNNQLELHDAKSRLNDIETQLDNADDTKLETLRDIIDQTDSALNDAQSAITDTQNRLAKYRQELSNRTSTMTTLQATIDRYEAEKVKLSGRLDDLTARADTLDAKIRAYKANEDDDTDALREELLSKIAAQDAVLKDIAITLEEQETHYKSLQTDLREAESNMAAARENRATAQANVANAETDLNRIEAVIKEKYDVTPQSLEEQTYSLFDHDIPSLETLHNDKDMITRQRDGIGPVNLRAAIESEETETHLSEMEREYNDLTQAIEQLRGGIAKLNREAKERLAIAFARVDAHFQKLFNQLFEGGTAHLEMVQSDDPMESGLEIYAQPPGKSLQKLSLLSGGEQTLTATALIFAMFLTNPSPICVLDEIDAPLDDANVDRVCTMMENIARDTDTRFVVITHHRMTMARMDRLYGVTMSERGVSQLVSVDMALQAEMDLAETA